MTMTVSDSAFINNGDGMGGGGALDGLDDCTAIFNRCILATGAKGALMRPNSAGSTTFNYCSFDTSAADSVSGPYINGGNCAVTFNNCTLYGGTAVNGYLLLSTGGTIAMHNCIVDHWWKEEGTGGSYTKDHCLTNAAGSVVDVTSTNALTGDPLFVEPSAGNFRLLTGSPAINAGTDLGLGADLAGHAVANPPEVGAYEFGPFTGATIGNMNAAALTVTP